MQSSGKRHGFAEFSKTQLELRQFTKIIISEILRVTSHSIYVYQSFLLHYKREIQYNKTKKNVQSKFCKL